MSDKIQRSSGNVFRDLSASDAEAENLCNRRSKSRNINDLRNSSRMRPHELQTPLLKKVFCACGCNAHPETQSAPFKRVKNHVQKNESLFSSSPRVQRT
jgi:hypothetical protein